MQIAVTGATGFLGRHLVERLAGGGHQIHGWCRPSSDRSGFDLPDGSIEWFEGSLREPGSEQPLVAGCEAVVHAALDRPGTGFRGAEGDLVEFATVNVIGTLRLIEAARAAGVRRFLFISSCAVHEKILPDRPLDETHPTWAMSHYGAHKAAIEQFVNSYGLGKGDEIAALRPCGIYGIDRPVEESKWFELVQKVVRGETVECRRGGKEVHAADVAKAADLLLNAPAESIRGQAFNCCERYISEYEVASLARQISGSDATIHGEPTQARNQIDTRKLQDLGLKFGGDQQLRDTIGELVTSVNG